MRKRMIPLPGMPDVDISRIEPIVDTKYFQRLRHRRQLGSAFLTFPSANHTRFEHSLGTFSLTQERTKCWLQAGHISAQEAWDISLYGLLHDIGHGPYSHLIEDLCGQNHNEHGLQVLTHLQSAIEECGGKFTTVTKLFSRSQPLSTAVSHRLLGTDKLDYLSRDALHTNKAVSLAKGALLNYVYFIEESLVIDITIISEVLHAMDVYGYMYHRVYGRKSCLIAQRFLQKMIWLHLQTIDFPEDRLWALPDSGLESLVFMSSDEGVRHMWQHLSERQLPKLALMLYPEGAKAHERVTDKDIRVEYVPLPLLAALHVKTSPRFLQQLEGEIAALVNIPSHAIVVIPGILQSRFVPPDIKIYDGNSFVGTLKQYSPGQYARLQEMAPAHQALRIGVWAEYRAQMASPAVAQKIIDYVSNLH